MKYDILEVFEDFVHNNGLKQIILIGTHGKIKNIEIEEIEDEI